MPNSDRSAHVLAIGLFVMIGIAVEIIAWYQSYITNRDVVGFLDRAQVAADIVRMDDYLAKLERGMIRYGMDTGHAAFLYKTPQNDVGSMYQVVKDLRHKRVPQAKLMDRASPEYQMALDDIRGICRELPINAYAYKFRLRHDLVWLYVGSIIYLILGCALFVDVCYNRKSTTLEAFLASVLIFLLVLILMLVVI